MSRSQWATISQILHASLKISRILLMRGSAMGLLGLGEVDLDPDGGDEICEERRSTVLPAVVARA